MVGAFLFIKIGFLFTDYFSPVLTNLTNAPDNFFYAPKLAFCMIAPALIAIGFIITALIKNKLNRELFAVASLTVFVLIAASLAGKLVFITKYSIEIYPILIYLACFGAAEADNKIIKNFLIGFYCLLSLGYLVFNQYSAPKIRRAEGHKIVTDMLNNMELKKMILFCLNIILKIVSKNILIFQTTE